MIVSTEKNSHDPFTQMALSPLPIFIKDFNSLKIDNLQTG